MLEMRRFTERDPIPPRSRVCLVRGDRETPSWEEDVGKEFRIGYYNPKFGFDEIWLVDDQGEYCQYLDHETLDLYFKILEISDEDDFIGEEREPLGPL